ncbi:DUF2182 domain-containing protein [Silvimonas iriomotensis]|uniref:DUF2182 domain-containing protein n=1 Tax=Silvimonas iriomotensis TaxID=449662 RepID=A0ABQ2PEG8_9NEIS|nr:DUF2182 domain-containing protein [Silvimonas iriomotensis]GGP23807.1 hypothetical protein GCM10010970_38070 [Silvimonas iriomotensis]
MTSTQQPERAVTATGGADHALPADGPTARIAFYGTMALLCLLAWLATARLYTPMAAMSGMPMPGGWTMSMMWMRMPGQSWISAAAGFMAMWLWMMAGMMLPVLAPALWQQRCTLASHSSLRKAWLNLVTACGYFLVWALAGLIIWLAGLWLADQTMRYPALARCVPLLNGLVVVMAGLAQFTRHKARLLQRCHDAPCHPHASTTRAAVWQGIRHGWHCNLCCANLTLVLLVCGMMDWAVMLAVTAAIVLERWHKRPWAASAIGIVLLGIGLWLTLQAGSQAALPGSAHYSRMWAVLCSKDCFV